MSREKLPESIWDLDPIECEEHSYEEFETLFLDAWEYNFYTRPAAERIEPYLQRYFRYWVIPGWVRTYVCDVLHGEAIENIANAPLDPAVDFRLYPWRLMTALLLMPTGFSNRKTGRNQLEA